MNKKLVLSVLSTAVVASMATSAFAAAPKAGVYLGGNIKKFYALDTLFNLNASAKTEFSNYIASLTSDFSQVVYVDASGKGASIQEILTEGYNTALNEALVAADFADQYSEVNASGQVVGTVDPEADLGGTPAGELKVESVSAIDATHIEVKFSKAVLADGTVNAADTAANYTVSGGVTVSSAAVGTDGKTVTLTLAGAGLTNDTAYTVVAKKSIEDANGQALSATTDYTTGIFFADHVAPTVTGITTNEAGAIVVNFNERLSTAPDVYLNGQKVTNVTFNAGDKFATVLKADIPAASNVTAGASVSVLVEKAKDLVNNTMSLYSGQFTYAVSADAPTLKSLTAKDEKTVTVEFSEGLAALGTTEVTVSKNGAAVAGITVNDVSNGAKTKFEIVLPNTVYATGETSASLLVEIKGYKDATGNFGANISQNVTVNKDVQGPTFVSAKYDDSAKEIQLTFNETLKVGTPASNKFILTDTNGVAYTATAKVLPGTTKVIALDTTADPDGAGALTALPYGTYTIQVLAGAAKDNSIAGNDNVAATATVTTASADPTAGAPTVTVAQGAKGVITATFSEAVKGGTVSGSATDVANYKLNGSALPAGTTITLDSTRTVATITLPAGAIATTQSNTVTVSNVQDLAGNAMSSATQIVTLTENTAPALVSAAYQVDGTIKLTFSENVVLSGATTTDEDDFTIKVNGNALVATDFTAAAGSTAKEVILSPAVGVSFATGTITITTENANTIADAAANVLKTDANVTVTR